MHVSQVDLEIGNIIGSVLSADCFARFCRARGLNTLYVCGSDEYGTASETKALEEKTTPAELCSKYHEIHKRIYADFSISFDVYGRTSTEQHTEIVQDIFTKLWENGFIEERTSVQPYCPTHHSFLADRFVEGICSICGYNDARGDQCDGCGNLLDPLEPVAEANDVVGHEAKGTGFLKSPRCKLDGTTPEARSTKHLYLRLDLLEDDVRKWFSSSSEQWSSNCIAITQSWLAKGLESRSITRDLKWGGLSDEAYENKVFYVWFDACIGYPSITKTYTDRDDLSGNNWEKWWKNPKDVTLYQFMGKDNVPFHSIVFPASQLGTREDWTKVSRFSTSEYLNYEGGKFSKSRNIGVFGTAVKDTGIDTDVWRFYLLSRRPETSDAEFLWQDFIDINNNDLLKSLGNLCQRVLKFCTANLDAIIPDPRDYTDEALEKHKADVNSLLQTYLSNMEAIKIRQGASNILSLSALGNQFLQHNKLSNQLIREEPKRCAAVVSLALNHIHLLANILCPYAPNTSASILTQLGIPKEKQVFSIPDIWTGKTLKPGEKLGTPTLLFSQIPAGRAAEWQEMFGGDELKKQKAAEAEKAAAKKAAKQKKKDEKNAKKAAATTTEEAPSA
ncbi:tRNA synthetases class I (M)-domain-containing protein [Nemania sp. FL0916]|nr:tRNA synthetases class I (M)-domain-containing protein [Nemania sp. FL0916]